MVIILCQVYIRINIMSQLVCSFFRTNKLLLFLMTQKTNTQDLDSVSIIIGNNIKKYREQRKFSQEKLALVCGLGIKYIGRLELGLHKISARNLFKISLILKIPIAKFFDGINKDHFRLEKLLSLN